MFIICKRNKSNKVVSLQRFLALSILVSIFGLIGNVYAPVIQNFKVFVRVGTEDENKMEKQIIESHIKRELRALGDVIIVDFDDDWQFSIDIIALGHTYKDGSKASGISIAKSVNVRVPKTLFKSYDFPLRYIPVYDEGLQVAHWTRDTLAEWCVLAANSIDEKHLKLFRDSR